MLVSVPFQEAAVWLHQNDEVPPTAQRQQRVCSEKTCSAGLRQPHLAGQISHVDEGIVEGGEDVSHAPHQLALTAEQHIKVTMLVNIDGCP